MKDMVVGRIAFNPTPGPWTLYDGGEICGLAFDGSLHVIAKNIHGGSPEARKANEYLIAAAPELYEALKSAVETIRAWHGEVAWPLYQLSPEMQRINKAIAKAEGR